MCRNYQLSAKMGGLIHYFDFIISFAILSLAVRDGRKYCLKEILKNSTDQYAGTGCPIS